ncbi:glycine--tRNA ligase subunit beta [Neomegalonema sp.]|uniref:glycine--tRNA ligase subunit beta n=1 Tax=Neomegalonema sp. TaxID=2039713 RepID=UPI0026150128|nr:glycine--tRNA ligase subunit beta [Neomegalonema sp.]MDD2867540.1 glycine--tRNA ligase subunit beta [Neomegalonema sp.]
MPDLLLELLSEEIPARMQKRAREDLHRLMEAELKAAGLEWRVARAFSTPRRLALAAFGLPAETAAQVEERKGPRVDAPDAAIEGFLRSTGLTLDELEVRPDERGAVYFAVRRKPGRATAEALREIVPRVIQGFPWPKSMRWGSGTLRWVRPLRSIICLFGEKGAAQVVPVEVENVPCGRTTWGHRVHAPAPIEVTGPEDYVEKLARAFVVLDQDARRKYLTDQIAARLASSGLEMLPDEALMEEVTGLVEWPNPLVGAVDPEFQELPAEVLQTSMREHQKYFSLRKPGEEKISGFVAAANLRPQDGGARMLAGYERVLRARLSDARFFWENDLATPLDARLERLNHIVFHARLGAQGDRVARLRALSAEVGEAFGADPEIVDRAALLAKADLVTDMVGEFPELQGRMGRRYAEAAGEDPQVAEAIEEHYRPVGAQDGTPRSAAAAAVAVADRLDLLVCFWTIDEKPTGSKDPFGLRRAAVGILRIMMENARRADLEELAERHYFLAERARQHVEQSERGAEGAVRRNLSVRVLDRLYEGDENAAMAAADLDRDKSLGVLARGWKEKSLALSHDLMSFFTDRLTALMRDEMGFRHDVVSAVLNQGSARDPALAMIQARMLTEFLAQSDSQNLLAAYKRAANILRAEERKESVDFSRHPDPALFQLVAEKALHEAANVVEAQAQLALKREDFQGALMAMTRLREPLDDFFRDVTVNAEDPALRRNRLRLLSRLRALMLEAADFDALEG